MRGLLVKVFQETWLMMIAFGVALGIVMGLLTFILPQVQSGMNEVLGRLPFMKTIVTALLGTEVGDQITAQMMQAILWVHPVVLALIWASEIVFCTRFPAAEIDRGTIDVLMALPVSRRAVFWSESIMWLVWGVVMLSLGLTGHLFMRGVMSPETRPTAKQTLLIMSNLYCVYVAVGGASLLTSAINDRRGFAMGAIFALLLVSYLINFIAQFWEPARKAAVLSVMHYYQPAVIMQSGLAARNVITLLAAGVVAWVIAGEIVAWRDMRTI